MTIQKPVPTRPRAKMQGFTEEIALFETALDRARDGERNAPLAFIGETGSGKTTLRIRMEEILQERRTHTDKRKRERIASATQLISSEDRMIDRLISIRVQLARTGGLSFMTFDWAFMRWFQMTHPDADVRMRHPNLFRSDGGGDTAIEIFNWMTESGKAMAEEAMEVSMHLVPGLSLLNKIRIGLTDGFIKWTRNKHVRPLLEQLEVLSDEELGAHLPELLGYDLETSAQKASVKTVLFIDGYQKLKSTFEYRGIDDEWLAKFLSQTPSTLAVIFSKSPVPKTMPPMDHTKARVIPRFDEALAKSFLSKSGMPDEYISEVLERYFGSPLFARISLDLYNEMTERENRSGDLVECFIGLLESTALQKLYNVVTRDMSVGAVRELTLAALLVEFERETILEAARHVFGGDADIDVNRLFNSGVIMQKDEDPTQLLVSYIVQLAVRASDRHAIIKESITERLINYYIRSTKDLLDQGSTEKARDRIRHSYDWIDHWSSKDVDDLRVIADAFLEKDYAETVYSIGKVLQARYLVGIKVASDLKERSPYELRRIKLGFEIMRKAALSRNNYETACECINFTLLASEYLGELDPAEFWEAARLSVLSNYVGDVAQQVQNAIAVEFAHLRQSLARLDRKVIVSDGNELTFQQIADAHSSVALSDLRLNVENADPAMFGIIFSDLGALLRDFGPSVVATDPLYKDKREIEAIIKESLARGRSAYIKMSELLMFSWMRMSESPPIELLLEQFDVAKEALNIPDAHARFIEMTGTVTHGGTQERFKLANQLNISEIKKEKKISTWGNDVFSYIELLKKADGFSLIITLSVTLEKVISEKGYHNSNEADHLMLAKVFSRYAEALSREGRPPELCNRKLKFACESFNRSRTQHLALHSHRAALIDYLRDELGAKVTVEMIGEEPSITDVDWDGTIPSQ